MNATSQQVLCQVCSHIRDCGKYRRHLKMHVRQGKLSPDDVEAIIFQSRYTRSTSRIKPHSRKEGKQCPIVVEGVPCSRLVLNLGTHLIRYHSITTSDKQYCDALKGAEFITKEIFYKSSIRVKQNPLHGPITNKEPIVTPQQSEKSIELYQPETPLLEGFNIDDLDPHSQVYSFTDESDTDDIISSVPTSISTSFLQLIFSFRRYSATIAGGCRCISFLKMETTNLMILCNSLGEVNIFNATKVNSFLTQELSSGKSPSTIQSRLYSLSRFLSYLKCYKPAILPNDKQLNDLTCLIKGAGISLSKFKKKRHQVIISKTRKHLPETINTLNQWRKKRKYDNTLHLFSEYAKESTLMLVECDYTTMRNFLILELIIPNGQRPGVIHGVTIDEIQEAKTLITPEGYNKLIVAKHKTGLLQFATLFIYPEIFSCLTILVDVILPKLPVYTNNVSRLTGYSSVFQTYTGQTISSSRVTPILRNYLLHMGIQFSGTITDLRKAAATLTGKFSPNLHELMALFMCHSVSTHDRSYRIHVGDDGLTEAFNSLEKFQSQSLNNLSPHVSELDHCQHSCDTLTPTNSSLASSPSQDSPCTFDNVQMMSSDDNNMDHMSLTTHFNINIQQKESNNTTQLHSIQQLAPDDSIPYPTNVDLPPAYISIDNAISPPIAKNSLCKSDHLKMKVVEIHLTKRIFDIGETRTNSFNELGVFSCKKTYKKKQILRHKGDDDIYKEVFDVFINRKNNIHVAKRLVIEQAHNCEMFAPVLESLYERFSQEVVDRKIVNKVRTLANKKQSSMKLRYEEFANKQPFGKGDLNLSSDAELYLLHKHFNKSIFSLKEDEVIFRSVFSELINRVAEHKSVSRHDILLAANHKKFVPVLSRLKYVYNEDAILKIVAKVRTVGYYKRHD